MTIYYGTGFQHGAPPSSVADIAIHQGVTYTQTGCLFGDRCLQMGDSVQYISYNLATPGAAFLSFWHRTTSGTGDVPVASLLNQSGGVAASVYYNEVSRFYTLRDSGGNVRATTPGIFGNGEWHHVEVGVDSSSVAALYIDGIQYGSFSGAQAIKTVKVHGRSHSPMLLNSFVVADERVGDLRFVRYVPNADADVDFTPSTEGSNYTCVDEVPPSTSDYVSATPGTADQYDLYETSGSAIPSNAQIAFVAVHVYASVALAEPLDLNITVGDGFQVEEIRTVNPNVNHKLYTAIASTQPNSQSGWSVDSISNLQIGFGIDAV